MPLVMIDDRQVGRTDTRMRVRPLIGLRGSSDLWKWPVPNDQAPSIADGEPCLLHLRPFHLLPLWPWLWVEPDQATGAPVVWMRDQLQADAAVYKSPQRPREQRRRTELRNAFRSLLIYTIADPGGPGRDCRARR